VQCGAVVRSVTVEAVVNPQAENWAGRWCGSVRVQRARTDGEWTEAQQQKRAARGARA